MVEWKRRESRQSLQLDSATLLSSSVSSAFCHRIRSGQNMRFSGESSQRSFSRRKNSFANTSPPPRRPKNVRALPIHAVRNSPVRLKAQGIGITGKCITCRASGWRGRYLKIIPRWSLYFISSSGGERNTVSSHGFPTDDSKKERLPVASIGFSYPFLNSYKHLRYSHHRQSISWASHSRPMKEKRDSHVQYKSTVGNQPPSQQLPGKRKKKANFHQQPHTVTQDDRAGTGDGTWQKDHDKIGIDCFCENTTCKSTLTPSNLISILHWYKILFGTVMLSALTWQVKLVRFRIIIHIPKKQEQAAADTPLQ